MRNGRSLKGLRADLGNITQRDMAKKLGISYSAYSLFESAIDDSKLQDNVAKILGAKIEVHITEA